MEFLFIWALCGIISLLIASSKNRSPACWAIAGFLLGPLGVLIVALLPKVE